MNLIEESFQQKEEKKKKRTKGIVLGAIIFIILVIIAISCYLFYVQSTTMRLILDGQSNESLKQIILWKDGNMYFPIKDVASYLGYNSYNGEYSQRSEEQSKCYVQSESEVANFSLNSKTIYKLDLTATENDYETVEVEEAIFAEQGVLYASTEAIQKAFNVSIQYDQNTNRIYIYTLPYLVQSYLPKVLDYGYTQISDVLANQKAILQNMLVVAKEDNSIYGVIDINGNTILEAKYDDITYLPEIGDFIVEANGKVGILGSKGESKVQIMYDSIQLMDSDSGLYVASNNNKYGVIDLRGNIKIYIENDAVGMDITPFSQNNIKNKYILAGNLIPVKKGELWALYDKNGNQLVDFEYDSFGYIAKTNRDALSLLVIPDYEVLVACKDEKYILLNSIGEKLFNAPIADDIYMTISGGQIHYYITVNNQTMDAEQYLDNIGVRKQSEGGNNTNNALTNANNQNSNQTNTQNTNSIQNNNEQGNQTTNNNQPQEGNGQTTEVNTEQPVENNGGEEQQPVENIEQQMF